MASEPLYEAREVAFTYPDGTRALSQVALSVASGEFLALLAANGSGKTTLLRVLLGLLRPQRGQVSLRGREVKSWKPQELYQTVGMVFQNPDDQLFATTVEEDVAFGPRNLGLSPSEVEGRVQECLEAVGASTLRSRAVRHLSFGERKRVCLAGVLAMRPAVMILDEPTAGLDSSGEAAMLHLLHELHRRGITLILATHSVDLLPLYVDRVCVLHRGEVRCQGTPPEIFSDNPSLEALGLRLPHVAGLFDEMRRLDGIALGDLPLTVGEARRRLRPHFDSMPTQC